MHSLPLAPPQIDTLLASPKAAARRRDDTSTWLQLLTPAPQVALTGLMDSSRQRVEHYIAQRYQISFGAQVQEFLPWLLSLECLDQLTGVAGMRIADAEPLFLEQYLDQPVEAILAARTGHNIARDSLVEIGNLVAAKRGASHLLFLLFTSVLQAAGYEHIVFTATRALRNNLEKLGFSLLELQAVDSARLAPDTLAKWGNYYRTEPIVVAGGLAAASSIIQSRPLLRRILRLYRPQIETLAAQLQRA